MKYRDKSLIQNALVLIYDPVPLDKVALDVLKQSFSNVASLPEQGVVLVEHNDMKIRALVGTAKLEFTNNSQKEFSESDYDLLGPILQALPPLRVKGCGINLHSRFILDEFPIAGVYGKSRLLAQPAELEAKLGAPIFATAHRIFYGEPDLHFDLRITPVDLAGPWLHVQLHRHKTISLTDPEMMKQQALSELRDTIVELQRTTDVIL